MPDTTKNALRALLPHAKDPEIQAAEERFRRYFQFAIEIAQTTEKAQPGEALTQSDAGGNVNPGKVDPARTLTNTG